MAIDTVAKIALLPLLVGQALHVRRKALILPEPPGPRAGNAGSGPDLRLLIIGDSSAAGVGAAHQNAALSGRLAQALQARVTLHWQLEASTGATTAAALKRLQSLDMQHEFDTALVVLGVNDVTRNVPVTRWIARQRALHDLLRRRFGVRRIVASGLPPMGHFPLLPQPLRWTLGHSAARLDAALAQLAAGSPDLVHLPLSLPYRPEYVAADGYHPSEAAYAHWADMLAPLIAP